MSPDVELALAEAIDVADQLGLRVMLVGAWARTSACPPTLVRHLARHPMRISR